MGSGLTILPRGRPIMAINGILKRQALITFSRMREIADSTDRQEEGSEGSQERKSSDQG